MMTPRKRIGPAGLLLALAANLWAQEEAVVIGGEAVPLSEYAYYYQKEPGRDPEAFLRSFIDYKLKVRYARDAGLDTLPAFRAQWAFYQGKLLAAARAEARDDEAALRRLYGQERQRLHTGDRVRVAHISRYLPQHAGPHAAAAARSLMDSVYAALQDGADFAALARRYSDDEESRDNGGLLPWLPVGEYVQEWADRISSLEKGEVSAPFYSPLGIHIIRWTDRKPPATYEEREEALRAYRERVAPALPAAFPEGMERRLQELHDGLLAACATQRQQAKGDTCREDDLKAYFNRHRADYTWELPHYRGAAIHCKDKKTAAAVRRYLKHKPFAEWEQAMEQITGNAGPPAARMEAGLFCIGENACIDKLVFRCGSFSPDAALPYPIVMGKKLKKGPESYQDIRETVRRDYLAENENRWMENLRKAYPVEINDACLKLR